MIDVTKNWPGRVDVLIGANGSGKSTKLRNIAVEALKMERNVIAIAPTLFDRFRNIRRPNFSFYGARQGQQAVVNIIRDTLITASSREELALKSLIRILSYTDFDPVVGIEVRIKDIEAIQNSEEITRQKRLISALHFWRRASIASPHRDRIIGFSLVEHSFGELALLDQLILLKYEKELRRAGVIKGIYFYFSRKGEWIPLLEACSGEISFVASMAFVANKISTGSLILVDEPENSLHPNWQKDYIGTLLDLFYYREPQIVLSTHSPIIISGGEMMSKQVFSHELRAGETIEFDHSSMSLEEMYDKLFQIITPKNHYLSNRSVEILNQIDAREITLADGLNRFRLLREKSYDDQQQKVIDGFVKIASELATFKYE